MTAIQPSHPASSAPTMFTFRLGWIVRDYRLYETNSPPTNDGPSTLTIYSDPTGRRFVLVLLGTCFVSERQAEREGHWMIPSAAYDAGSISDLVWLAVQDQLGRESPFVRWAAPPVPEPSSTVVSDPRD